MISISEGVEKWEPGCIFLGGGCNLVQLLRLPQKVKQNNVTQQSKAGTQRGACVPVSLAAPSSAAKGGSGPDAHRRGCGETRRSAHAEGSVVQPCKGRKFGPCDRVGGP